MSRVFACMFGKYMCITSGIGLCGTDLFLRYRFCFVGL